MKTKPIHSAPADSTVSLVISKRDALDLYSHLTATHDDAANPLVQGALIEVCKGLRNLLVGSNEKIQRQPEHGGEQSGYLLSGEEGVVEG